MEDDYLLNTESTSNNEEDIKGTVSQDPKRRVPYMEVGPSSWNVYYCSK